MTSTSQPPPIETPPPPMEVSTPPAGVWHRRVLASFALANYRWFFFGQGTSVLGLWMRDAAQGWLVYDLTGSYALLGIVTAVWRGAMGLVTPLGGAIADRVPKRRLLMLLAILSGILSLTLGGLVLAGAVRIWHIVVLAALTGVVKGFEIPTRQSFVVEMVGRDLLPNAIALNTAMFNSARVLGPLAAGLLMHSFDVGIALCFLADGISYLAIFYSLTRIRPLPTSHRPSGGGWGQQLAEGIAFATGNRRVRSLMLLLIVFVTFGWTYLTILPAFARTILGLDEKGYGLLMALNGLGALLGAIWVASGPESIDRRRLRRAIFGAISTSALAVIVFGLAQSTLVAGAALIVAGFGAVGFLSRANALVQLAVPDELRGRVMSLWVLIFIGGMAIGGVGLGYAAEALGAPLAVAASGTCCALLSGIIFVTLPAVNAPQSSVGS